MIVNYVYSRQMTETLGSSAAGYLRTRDPNFICGCARAGKEGGREKRASPPFFMRDLCSQKALLAKYRNPSLRLMAFNELKCPTKWD